METSPLPGLGARGSDAEDPAGDAAGPGPGPEACEARRPVAEWTVAEVCVWLSGGPLGPGAYGLLEATRSHAIAGKALLRLTDETLERMGVVPWSLRHDLLHEVLCLRLREEMEDLLRITDE